MKFNSCAALAILWICIAYSKAPAYALESERVSPNTMAAETISQLNAGHPDESARIIRVMLLNLQLALPMDPAFSKNSAELYAKSPQTLKEFFYKALEKENANADTKDIIDSLINNTVPKDYSKQLEKYCARMDSALKQLEAFKSTADEEQLKYGDPLTSLQDSNERKSQESGGVTSDVNITAVEKLAKTLHELATEAQQMPVGDARSALGLYGLALVANSMKQYQLAETYANQSISHLKALTEEIAGLPDVQIALAYALLKQEKLNEFAAIKDEILKQAGERERLLITLARFCEIKHDDSEALRIYKIAMDNRVKQNNSQKPEWQNDYDALLERTKQK